jgi:hypothetical protein
MKHYLSKITVHDTVKALREAERELERPEVTNGGPVYVQVRPQDIGQRLELFQPRRPGWGTRELDTKHVSKLKTRIDRKGELDPVLIVKLGSAWVVVDGHHRVAAYVKLKRTEPIKCEWFAGTVREAMDAGLRRNEKTHLEVDQADKAEAAWTRTLLDWNGAKWRTSRRDMVELTGCGDGTVAHMRRIVKWHYNSRTGAADQHPMGETLCKALGHDLSMHSWNRVKEEAVGFTPKQRDANEAAAALARNLDNRMPILRTTDPEVTAQALWLYDRDMCSALADALQRRVEKEAKGEQDLDDQAAYEALEATEVP